MPIRPQTTKTSLLAALILVAGCEAGLSGRYADEAEVTVYEFHDDGRAEIHVLGETAAAEYTLDNDRVIVSSPQGTVVLRRDGDRLRGPMGLTLVRQPKRAAPESQQRSARRRENDG